MSTQGKYDEAESLHRDAMDTTESTKGRDHPEFAERLNSLADLLHDEVRRGGVRGVLDAF